MFRYAEKQVRSWIESPRRKPLIVRGARQVGKTWLVENAAAAGFEFVVKVDLEMREGDLLDMFRGRLAEQFAAQELIASHADQLFHWSRDARGSSAEVDFVVVQDGRILPSR